MTVSETRLKLVQSWLAFVSWRSVWQHTTGATKVSWHTTASASDKLKQVTLRHSGGVAMGHSVSLPSQGTMVAFVIWDVPFWGNSRCIEWWHFGEWNAHCATMNNACPGLKPVWAQLRARVFQNSAWNQGPDYKTSWTCVGSPNPPHNRTLEGKPPTIELLRMQHFL